MKHIAYIHGLNSSPLSFSYIAENLPEHKSYLIRYKSHQRLGDSIAEVLAQLPPDQKLTLVGHSLGGVIAALIAGDNPGRIEKLVGISSPFRGSRAACTLRWLPGSMLVFDDIVPRGHHIVKCRDLTLEVPTLSIITTGGHLQTSPEPNDGVVAVESQKGLRFGKKIEINANHFEVLLSDRTVGILEDFIFGDDDD